MTTRQALASFAWLALFALIVLLGIVGCSKQEAPAGTAERRQPPASLLLNPSASRSATSLSR
jgi:hypothetical protein